MTQNKKGFTLIELMVVMAIIAVLAVLMIGAIQLARRTATETTHRSNAKTIQTGLEGTYAKYRQYCGATGQPVSCTSSTGTVSFAAIAAPGQLAVTLGAANTSNTCDAASANNGGGRVSVTTTGYKIIPVVYDCVGAGDTTTIATGDLATDVLSMP